jgi:hypothetical protein
MSRPGVGWRLTMVSWAVLWMGVSSAAAGFYMAPYEDLKLKTP